MTASGHLVLGAGCAGLGLAVALLDAGIREPITLVDRRTAFERDRTWCLWDTGDERWRRLARHRWASWEVLTPQGRAAHRSSRHPYLHVDAPDYYAWALERLERAPQVRLLLGERVTDAGEDDAGVWATTARERLEGAWLHDARGLASPAVDTASVAVWQGFLGQVVEVDRPLFDPAVATLMDFRVPQGGELRFVYVLPLSRTRALVEDTSFGARAIPAAERREALGTHLEGLGAREWSVEHEEAGRLPMALGVGAAVRGARTTGVGIAGGALRPSSGYAFARTQLQVTALARALAAGRPPPTRIGTERLELLDAAFLRALSAAPAAFPEHLRALVARTPADAFARFMGDAGTARDELRVVAALGPARALAAAAAVAAASSGP